MRPFGTYTECTRMPPHIAETARASGWGNPGAPGIPVDHAVQAGPGEDGHPVPPRLAVDGDGVPPGVEIVAQQAVNASSASLVSCRQTTSGWRWSSHGSRRGIRCLTEFTFHVATRTGLTVAQPPAARQQQRKAAHRDARDDGGAARRLNRPGRVPEEGHRGDRAHERLEVDERPGEFRGHPALPVGEEREGQQRTAHRGHGGQTGPRRAAPPAAPRRRRRTAARRGPRPGTARP